jgi:hypothetical protein
MSKRIKILVMLARGATQREISVACGGDGNQLHGIDMIRLAYFLPSKYGFH